MELNEEFLVTDTNLDTRNKLNQTRSYLEDLFGVDGSINTVIAKLGLSNALKPELSTLITGNWGFQEKVFFYGGGIELYGPTPYFDFHFDNFEGDFTSRIMESQAGLLSFYSQAQYANVNFAPSDTDGTYRFAHTGMVQRVASSYNNMPSNRSVNLSLGASGATYTAPANGYFYLNKVAGIANAYITMTNTNAASIATLTITPSSVTAMNIYLPAKKGDVISVGYSATGNTNTFKFIYDEGSK